MPAPEYNWDYERNSFLLEVDEPRAVKLVEMHPQDFLDLAAPMTFAPERVDFLKKVIGNGEVMALPYIEMTVMEDRTCRITGHEGRHRAEASRQLGIDRIPVVFYLRERVQDKDGIYHYPFLDWAADPCCHHQKGKESGRNYLICHTKEQAGDMTLGKDGWIGPAPASELDVFLIEREIDWKRTPLAKAPSHWRREHGLDF